MIHGPLVENRWSSGIGTRENGLFRLIFICYRQPLTAFAMLLQTSAV